MKNKSSKRGGSRPHVKGFFGRSPKEAKITIDVTDLANQREYEENRQHKIPKIGPLG